MWEMSSLPRPKPDKKQLYKALCWWMLGEHRGYELSQNNQYIIHDSDGRPMVNENQAMEDMILILDEDPEIKRE